MTTTTVPINASTKLIRLNYFWYVGAALAVMVAAILSRNIWFLNWVHVMSGVLWTGIDLFMGFVLGPILGRVDVSVRKQILLRLVPRTVFLMPTVALITGTAGWFLAVDLRFTELPWPQIAWLYGTLALIAIMTIQGFGYLLPTELRVCFELQKLDPDHARIKRMMGKFFYVVAFQGAMQVAIIVVMAKFVSGI
jgi:hypothetical protein